MCVFNYCKTTMLFKIIQALSEKEISEGCPTRLAKKTVLTIVEKLAKDGYLKSMITTLKLGDDMKKVCTTFGIWLLCLHLSSMALYGTLTRTPHLQSTIKNPAINMGYSRVICFSYINMTIPTVPRGGLQIDSMK